MQRSPAGSTDEAKIIGDAQKRSVISAKTERSELKRRGILGPDFKEEDEEQRLAEEQQGLELEPEQPMDPIPVTYSHLNTHPQSSPQTVPQRTLSGHKRAFPDLLLARPVVNDPLRKSPLKCADVRWWLSGALAVRQVEILRRELRHLRKFLAP